MLSFASSVLSVNGCSANISVQPASMSGNLCNRTMLVVAPGVQRLIKFDLFRKSDLVLLDSFTLCLDRTSEPVPEGFLFSPPAEELETD